jgi:hypothetical protein
MGRAKRTYREVQIQAFECGVFLGHVFRFKMNGIEILAIS